LLLRVNNLCAGYGDVQVLWDIDLEVRERQIVSLVGANGAGKSTLLKVLSDLLAHYAGKIVFQDDEISLGLAPLIVDDLIDVVREINRQGTGVLLVEQDVKLALDNSNYGYVLSTGKIVIQGTSASLLQNRNIKEIYLGM